MSYLKAIELFPHLIFFYENEFTISMSKEIFKQQIVVSFLNIAYILTVFAFVLILFSQCIRNIMAKQLFTGRKNRVTLKPRYQQYFVGLFMSDQLKLTWNSPICGNECTFRLLQSIYWYPAILF